MQSLKAFSIYIVSERWSLCRFLRLCHMMLCNLWFCYAIKFTPCGMPSDFLAACWKHVIDTSQILEHVLYLRVESLHLTNQHRGEKIHLKKVRQNGGIFTSKVCSCFACLYWAESKFTVTAERRNSLSSLSELESVIMQATVLCIPGEVRSKQQLFESTWREYLVQHQVSGGTLSACGVSCSTQASDPKHGWHAGCHKRGRKALCSLYFRVFM